MRGGTIDRIWDGGVEMTKDEVVVFGFFLFGFFTTTLYFHKQTTKFVHVFQRKTLMEH